MKKLSLLLIFSALQNLSFAQEVKTIEFDFPPEKTDTNKFPVKINKIDIKEGDFYRVKINGINKNLYEVSLTTSDTVLSKPQKTPVFGDFDFGDLSELIAGIETVSTSVNMMSNIMGLETTDNGDSSEPMNTVKDTKTNLKNDLDSLRSIKQSLDSLKFNAYKVKLNSYRLNEEKGFSYSYDDAIKEIDSIRLEISNLTKKVEKEKKDYEDFYEIHKSKFKNSEELTKIDKEIRASFNGLLTSLSAAGESVSADKSLELLSSIVFIENNDDWNYVSMPIQFTGEQTKVKITLTPRSKDYNLQSYQTQIVFPQVIKNYTVVGLSLYGATLYDKAYSTIKTEQNDSVFTYSFKEENNSKAELGVAALLRMGKKFNDAGSFGAHFSFGAGASVSHKVRPRLLLGGGISFGKKHMLAFDGGFITGYVDRLSSAVDLSETYADKPENITVSKLGFGGFFSIGYMFQF